MSRLWRKWYSTKEWRSIRLECFKRDLFKCQLCGVPTHITKDRTSRTAATCDHITAHRGDKELFFNLSNTQTLCKGCHDSSKQREEHDGFSRRIAANGWPVDRNHPFNKRN